MKLTPFEIEFKYDYPSGYFFRNQTVCMSFDGNRESLLGQKWDTRECQTIYNINEDDNDKSTLICRCDSVQNFYQGIITDRTRILEVQLDIVE